MICVKVDLPVTSLTVEFKWLTCTDSVPVHNPLQIPISKLEKENQGGIVVQAASFLKDLPS